MNEVEQIFNSDEQSEIINNAGELAFELINADPMQYIYPNFHSYIFDEVFNELKLQIQLLYDDIDIENELKTLINEALNICFIHVFPKRSYYTTNINIKPNIENINKIINYLKSVPQAEQRTPEWYEQRHKYLTASSIWKVFGSESNQNELILSKCKPIDTSKYSRVNLDSPLHWGQKYEELSIMWYENEYNTKVGEFGCIPHKTISYLAASPDGINIDPTSDRYGRMVEVKNIVNREITGIPKLEYWVQMQVQLEVCNLKECDFLETRFIEYETEEDFFADGTFQRTIDNKQKGVMMLFFTIDGSPKYEYMPWNANEAIYNKWQQDVMEKNTNLTWLKNIFWKLDEISVVLVVKNKKWFECAKPILDNFWKTIEYERINGYEHRFPNKKIKQTNNIIETKKSECFVKINKPIFCIDTEKL